MPPIYTENRETVGLFADNEHLQEAISELEISGFDRRHISLRGSDAAMRRRFGNASLPSEILEDHPDTPRSAEIKLEEVGIGQGIIIGMGILLGALFAWVGTGEGIVTEREVLTVFASAAVGGLAGGFLAYRLGERYRRFFRDQAATGGVPLWVSTPDAKKEARAQAILKKHGARDVHTRGVSATFITRPV